MGVKIKGLKATIDGLSKKAHQGSKMGEDELVKQAKILARVARDYAPVKHGHLQSAQAIYAKAPSRAGIKFQVKVVMGEKPVTIGGKTRDVKKYGRIIHDMRGVLWENLGKRSEEKGPGVGDLFLSRAVEDKRDEIVEAVRRAVKQGYKAK